MPKPSSINPASEAIVLRYTGDDAGHPSISGVPARDLSGHDLARIAYRRVAAAHDASLPAPDPNHISASDLAAVRDELIGSAIYAPAGYAPATEPATASPEVHEE